MVGQIPSQCFLGFMDYADFLETEVIISFPSPALGFGTSRSNPGASLLWCKMRPHRRPPCLPPRVVLDVQRRNAGQFRIFCRAPVPVRTRGCGSLTNTDPRLLREPPWANLGWSPGYDTQMCCLPTCSETTCRPPGK